MALLPTQGIAAFVASFVYGDRSHALPAPLSVSYGIATVGALLAPLYLVLAQTVAHTSVKEMV